jgi:acyl-CoA thioester hydrolase
LNPALYDDELVILTTIPQMPSARIRFEYETYRADELLNRASTDLVFVNQSTGRPMRCPKNVAAALSSYF